MDQLLKYNKNIMGSEIFNKRLKEISPETKIYSELLLDISDQITECLKKENLSQKDLSDKLGIPQAEISKWMSGSHNFTIKTIAKISAALNHPILIAPMYVNEIEVKDEMDLYNPRDYKMSINDLHKYIDRLQNKIKEYRGIK